VWKNGVLLEALDAVLQGTVDFENIMQLKQLEKLHHFGINVTDLEKSVVVVRGFHDGKENSETRTVNEVDIFKVQDQLGFGLMEIILQLFFDRLGYESIKTVNVIESDYDNVLDCLCF
jgi:hypothetical protein